MAHQPEKQDAPLDIARSVSRDTFPDEGKVQYRNRVGDEIDTTTVQPGTDPVYEAKVALMNRAILDLGMGKYQWSMAILTGFGWYTDNVSYAILTGLASTDLGSAVQFWLQAITVISPFVQREFVVKRIACQSHRTPSYHCTDFEQF